MRIYSLNGDQWLMRQAGQGVKKESPPLLQISILPENARKKEAFPW